MLYIGTSGFSYRDWVGVFYPEGMKPQDYLAFYSERFSCVELDFTYYRQPSPATMRSMSKKVPKDFKFTVKAHKSLTHQVQEGEGFKKELDAYIQGVTPMVESGKLGCILFQFPWSFKPLDANLEYVLSLRDLIPFGEVVVEFRNSAWADQAIYDALRARGIGFCSVDEPSLKGLFPRVEEVTSSIGYLRFHGRNAEKWFSHDEPWERYNYLYTDDELKEWIPKIRRMEEKARDVYILYNNCHRGQAAINAGRMQELLGLSVRAGSSDPALPFPVEEKE